MKRYEELIIRLLDDSITPAEQKELEELILASPEVAEEARRATLVDGFLLERAYSERQASDDWRKRVEDIVKSEMRSESKRKKGLPIGLFRWGRGAALAIGGLVVVASLGVWLLPDSGEYLRTSDDLSPTAVVDTSAQREVPDREASSDEPVPRDQAPAVGQPDGIETQGSPKSRLQPPQTEISENGTPFPATPDTVNTAHSGQHNAAGRIGDGRSKRERITILIDQERQLLKQAIADGNPVAAGYQAKRIGRLYRHIGSYNAGERYLKQALEIARDNALRELEGQVLGEYGLLKRDQGKRTQALEYLERCVAVLLQIENSDIAHWKRELSQMNAQP